jgi:hypothetical protein
MRKFLFIGLIVLATLGLALSVSGQEEEAAAPPSISAGDQLVLDGTVTVSSVTSDGPGFVVIFNDSGRGSPAQPIGSTWVGAGSHENVAVEIDTSLASPTMFAQLHLDDVDEGVFDRTAGADALVTVDDEPVRAEFSAPLIAGSDQFVAENTVTIDTATIGEPGWLVIHADNEGAPGPVIGQTLLESGRTRNVTVELSAEGQTDVLWPMLHVDTGEAGVYEFGSVEGADTPVIVDGNVAVLPIWTVPHIRVSDQIVTDSVVAESVLSEGPGFLVIHQEANGTFGGVAGVSDPLPPGLSTDVVITVDPSLLTSNVWPMLHVDTGVEGGYEFGTVEGADGPVVVNEQVVTFPIHATPFIEMSNQPVVDNTVVVERVLADQQGWLVIHQDQNGTYGPLAGLAPVSPGLTTNLVIELDPALVTPTLWPMLHADTVNVGEYEFGTVNGADFPIQVDGQVVTFPIVASDCVLTVLGPQNANVRSAPGTDATVLRTVPAGGLVGVSGQTEGGEFVWWQVADGGWIRSDLVEESGSCDSIPVVETLGSGVAAPAATEEAGS